MANRLHITPDRKTRENHSECASTLSKVMVDEDRESSEFPMENNICSPCDSTASAQYDGERLAFGDAGVDII